MATTQGHCNVMLLAVLLVVAALLWLPLVNAPPASIGAHAIERHGEDAMYGWNDYQKGDCAEVWRNTGKNRVIRVVGSGMVRFGIVTTLSSKPVTAYPAPMVFWEIRLAGWERMGTEGGCE